MGRIGLLSCISAVAAAVAFAVQALVRNQSDETIALAPYSSLLPCVWLREQFLLYLRAMYRACTLDTLIESFPGPCAVTPGQAKGGKGWI